ncbi:GNAT family N-acetyltransferase [Nocardioides terrisoli]|uniref:GNAT family N-acetyltransferase n=1 Tax=Nocardioides terrisoli TaxID=3388267 RepID=UPI00287B6266|nr:GNAT family N-acetyltransferase [Nocardioides marmorisolisilvae]
MTSLPLDPDPALPEGYTARVPEAGDVARIAALVTAERRRVRGSGAANVETLTQEVVGTGSWTRRQIVVEAAAGGLVAWASVHDRAAGRTMVQMVLAPEHDTLAVPLLDWIAAAAGMIGAHRGLEVTQLDALLDEGATELAEWFREAGYRHTRTWLNMTRRVASEETFPEPRDGVEVRRVGVHALPNGTTLPVAEDLHAVHRMLEESFEDHFNSYRESFAEFAQRLREDPGHRWDHWWLALVEDEGAWVPGGALVSSVSPPDDTGVPGSYVDYIGVHRRARGRGVAKALLHTVLADAAERGRNRVSLEVDADSPTGADGLYRSLGWETSYITESWQQDLPIR